MIQIFVYDEAQHVIHPNKWQIIKAKITKQENKTVNEGKYISRIKKNRKIIQWGQKENKE